MQRILLAAAFPVALILIYAVMLPATWLDTVLQRGTRNSLVMTATAGTLWRGEGILQALLPNGETATLAPVSWRIALKELLLLRLHLILFSQQNTQPVLDVSLSPGGIHINKARLAVPAAILGVLSPTLQAASLSGQLTLQVDDLRLDRGQVEGKARAIWTSAGSALSRVNPLGSYELDLDGSGAGLDFHLNTLGGVLTLSGSGSWRVDTGGDYQIMATPAESKRQDLAPMLRMLGREISPGTYRLTIDRSVRAVSG
ncbi:MAG TPA: type II secretion system protein N [Thiobacillaceae bacterium]|nr:type II secretion system protein N [Thiobacillaceae bacterium]HNU64067.1 type II secretion system protein N [Thiobacillaceae bacterium]